MAQYTAVGGHFHVNPCSHVELTSTCPPTNHVTNHHQYDHVKRSLQPKRVINVIFTDTVLNFEGYIYVQSVNKTLFWFIHNDEGAMERCDQMGPKVRILIKVTNVKEK